MLSLFLTWLIPRAAAHAIGVAIPSVFNSVPPLGLGLFLLGSRIHVSEFAPSTWTTVTTTTFTARATTTVVEPNVTSDKETELESEYTTTPIDNNAS